MGGGLSLLQETDWEKADGKLRGAHETIDGAPPLEEYGVFELTKKGVNQREYDVTDSEKNLIFTTRAVPGTIACFDVLGKGIDEYLLRVTVDLARRYWIIYRYDTPSFEGQIADKAESEKASTDYPERNLLGPLQLFKRGCVIVSWSRYIAISCFFGPPTVEMLMASSSIDDDSANDDDNRGSDKVGNVAEGGEPLEDDLFAQASQISARMRERTVSADGSLDPPKVSFSYSSGVEESKSFEEESPNDKAANTHGNNPSSDTKDTDGSLPTESVRGSLSEDTEVPSRGVAAIQSSASMPEIGTAPSNKDDDSLASGSVHSTASRRTRLMASASAASVWIRQKSARIREKKNAYLYSTTNAKHPLEGVIHLDKPLLLCQEIYNKFIGNHQTIVVSKEKALELLEQDNAQHVKDHPDDLEEAAADDPVLTVDGKVIVPSEDENKEVSPDNTNGDVKTEGELRDAVPSSSIEDDKEQPLVGYWNWEHNFRAIKIQKMRMHVAKGADLALHVVVAILVNQVRYERNALAMTI